MNPPAAAAAALAQPGGHFLPRDSEGGHPGHADDDGDACAPPTSSSSSPRGFVVGVVPRGAVEGAGRGTAESRSR